MFKRIIYNSYTVLLAAALLSSCVNDEFDNQKTPVDGEPYISFRIYTGAQTRTGEESLSDTEKTMETVDLFFYAQNADNDTPAILSIRCDGPEDGENLEVRFPSQYIEKLLGGDNSATEKKFKVYAAINMDLDEAAETTKKGNGEDTPTVNQLFAWRSVTETFANSATFKKFTMFSSNSTGDEITYTASNKKLSGTINVKTLAAKIELYVGIKDEVEWNGVKYTPEDPLDDDYKDAGYLVNGTKAVRLGGYDQNNTVGDFLQADDYFDLRVTKKPHTIIETKDEDLKAEYPYRVEAFYTYPNEWTTTPSETHRTMMILKVYWMEESAGARAATEAKATYYSVPLNLSGDDANKLVSNKYYRIKVKIETLGGENMEAPVVLDNCSCEILQWIPEELESDAREPRYLEVKKVATLTTFPHHLDTSDLQEDESEVKDVDADDVVTYDFAAIMNNETRVTIPYSSSHPVKVLKAKITYLDYFSPTTRNLEEESNRTTDRTMTLPQVAGYKPIPTNIFVAKTWNSNTLEDTNYSEDRKKKLYDAHDEISVADNFVISNENRERLDELESDGKTYKITGAYIDKQNQQLIFQHPLRSIVESDGVMISAGEKLYTPYLITITLCHTDDESYFEDVHIMQYPAIYLGYTHNDNAYNGHDQHLGHYAWGTGGNDNILSNRGGVYVNSGSTVDWGIGSGGNYEGRGLYQLGGITGLTLTRGVWSLGKSYSWNPIMYVINVTQLTEDDISDVAGGHTFHIGDPRAIYINNHLGDKRSDDALTDNQPIETLWTSDSELLTSLKINTRREPVSSQRFYPTNESNGKLKYYYPTREGTEDEEAYMIAPIFRIASAYGEVNNKLTAPASVNSNVKIYRETARKRCAAYQEFGYPAGRWRLPTLGEISIVMDLMNKQIIPEIFDQNDSQPFYTAQGLYRINNGKLVAENSPNLNTDIQIRCVYDDWYWVNEKGEPDVILPDDSRIDPANFSGYFTDYRYDRREIFVWGDKEKKNPQIPIDPTKN